MIAPANSFFTFHEGQALKSLISNEGDDAVPPFKTVTGDFLELAMWRFIGIFWTLYSQI